MSFIDWVRSDGGPNGDTVEYLRRCGNRQQAELDFLDYCLSAYKAGAEAVEEAHEQNDLPCQSNNEG